eukprot:Tbor_TRINITY_DN5470_c0_g1::TRINITY_DN5470_c0_g1_i11::g.24897::m.24897
MNNPVAGDENEEGNKEPPFMEHSLRQGENSPSVDMKNEVGGYTHIESSSFNVPHYHSTESRPFHVSFCDIRTDRAAARKRAWEVAQVSIQADMHMERRELFYKFDKKGKGKLTLEETKDGSYDFPFIDDIPNPDAVITQAFCAAKEANLEMNPQPDTLNPEEFHLYLRYFRNYCELANCLNSYIEGKLTREEFKTAIPFIQKWGITPVEADKLYNELEGEDGTVEESVMMAKVLLKSIALMALTIKGIRGNPTSNSNHTVFVYHPVPTAVDSFTGKLRVWPSSPFYSVKGRDTTSFTDDQVQLIPTTAKGGRPKVKLSPCSTVRVRNKKTNPNVFLKGVSKYDHDRVVALHEAHHARIESIILDNESRSPLSQVTTPGNLPHAVSAFITRGDYIRTTSTKYTQLAHSASRFTDVSCNNSEFMLAKGKEDITGHASSEDKQVSDTVSLNDNSNATNATNHTSSNGTLIGDRHRDTLDTALNNGRRRKDGKLKRRNMTQLSQDKNDFTPRTPSYYRNSSRKSGERIRLSNMQKNDILEKGKVPLYASDDSLSSENPYHTSKYNNEYFIPGGNQDNKREQRQWESDYACGMKNAGGDHRDENKIMTKESPYKPRPPVNSERNSISNFWHNNNKFSGHFEALKYGGGICEFGKNQMEDPDIEESRVEGGENVIPCGTTIAKRSSSPCPNDKSHHVSPSQSHTNSYSKIPKISDGYSLLSPSSGDCILPDANTDNRANPYTPITNGTKPCTTHYTSTGHIDVLDDFYKKTKSKISTIPQQLLINRCPYFCSRNLPMLPAAVAVDREKRWDSDTKLQTSSSMNNMGLKTLCRTPYGNYTFLKSVYCDNEVTPSSNLVKRKGPSQIAEFNDIDIKEVVESGPDGEKKRALISTNTVREKGDYEGSGKCFYYFAESNSSSVYNRKDSHQKYTNIPTITKIPFHACVVHYPYNTQKNTNENGI